MCSLVGMSDEPYYLPVSRKGDYRFKAINTNSSESQIINESIDSVEEKCIEVRWSPKTNIFKFYTNHKKPLIACFVSSIIIFCHFLFIQQRLYI